MSSSIIKLAKKLNAFATSLDDETGLAKISDWIDLGFLGLNAIISADCTKGLPCGRVTTLFGPSKSGKSLISALAQKGAQDKGMTPIILDTEFDKDGRMEKSFGVDTSNVLTLPIESIEELIIQCTKLIDQVIENEEFGKYLFIVDSLGFITSNKELSDAAGSNASGVAMDMGLKAKMIKTFLRTIKGKVAKSKCPLLLINHEIANPNTKYESAFKEQGGGNAITLVSTVMINVSATMLKQDKGNELDVESIMANLNYTGQNINLFTQKNRCAIPHKKVECYLNYVTGIDRYSGLKEVLDMLPNLYTMDAKGEKGKGHNYYIEIEGVETKLGKYKEWQSNKELWDKYLLPEVNKIVKETFAFKEHG